MGTVSITVNAVNDPPVCSGDSATTDEDLPVTIAVMENDNRGPVNEDQTLSVDTVTQAIYGTVENNPDGTVTYTPDPDYYGADSFNYTVSDSDGLTDEGTVDVTVNAVNDTPAISADLS